MAYVNVSDITVQKDGPKSATAEVTVENTGYSGMDADVDVLFNGRTVDTVSLLSMYPYSTETFVEEITDLPNGESEICAEVAYEEVS